MIFNLGSLRKAYLNSQSGALVFEFRRRPWLQIYQQTEFTNSGASGSPTYLTLSSLCHRQRCLWQLHLKFQHTSIWSRFCRFISVKPTKIEFAFLSSVHRMIGCTHAPYERNSNPTYMLKSDLMPEFDKVECINSTQKTFSSYPTKKMFW